MIKMVIPESIFRPTASFAVGPVIKNNHKNYLSTSLTALFSILSPTVIASSDVMSEDSVKVKLNDVIDRSGEPMMNIKDILNVETVIRNGEVFKIEDLLKK